MEVKITVKINADEEVTPINSVDAIIRKLLDNYADDMKSRCKCRFMGTDTRHSFHDSCSKETVEDIYKILLAHLDAVK